MKRIRHRDKRYKRYVRKRNAIIAEQIKESYLEWYKSSS